MSKHNYNKSMLNINDNEMFGRFEHKVEKDVENSWHEAEHPSLKQVVILAGPQLTGMRLAHQFFIHHASRYRPNQRSASLSGWAWPWIDPTNTTLKKFLHPLVTRDRLFDLLIEYEDNEPLVQLLLTEIERTWTQDAFKGIVLGSEYFDQTPDSTRMIQRILDKLGVQDPKQVSIVLNYPSSRVTQWNEFFSIATQNAPMSYHDYICNPIFASSSLERLKTSTNPIQLAQEYRSHDWTVTVIDLQGLAAAQKDPAHVIACRILSGTTCEQDNVVDIPVYPTNISSTGDSVSELDAMQQEQLEKYFADRDCFYQDDLVQDGPRFDVLFKTTLWSKCASNQSMAIDYEQLSEPTFLWSLVRAQVSCPIDHVSTNNTGQVVQQNISRVTDSVEKQAVDGNMMKLVFVPVVFALLAFFIVAVRYRKRRQGMPVHSGVLRMWDRSDELTTKPAFSSATLTTSALSMTQSIDSFQHSDLILESQVSRGTLT